MGFITPLLNVKVTSGRILKLERPFPHLHLTKWVGIVQKRQQQLLQQQQCPVDVRIGQNLGKVIIGSVQIKKV